MSQSKTRVPGMENSYSSINENTDGYHQKVSNANSYAKGTKVPGMEGNIQQNQMGESTTPQYSSKPVIGFLYSISRQGIGEYWPLHIGSNTIGTSPNCDICLREATVSSEHAVLVVRKMKKPEKTIASISDARSTNGTMVNGESLGFSAIECVNGDIITIGESYELVLILIDINALGLKVAEKFMPLDNETEPAPEFPSNGETRAGGINPPRFDENRFGSQGFSPNFTGTTDGTVGLDGTNQQVRPGGTIGM